MSYVISILIEPGDVTAGAESAITRFLEARGFEQVSGLIFAGSERETSVDAVLAVQEMTAAYTWFSSIVESVEMWRVGEVADLMPAVLSV